MMERIDKYFSQIIFLLQYCHCYVYKLFAYTIVSAAIL